MFSFLRRNLRRERDAFQAVLGANTEDARIVLRRLQKMCHANSSAWDPDPRVHAFREGRREIWLRIVKLMALTDKQVSEITESED